MRNLICFAKGRNGSWEALCVDYEIAVQGSSFLEVQAEFASAISDYVAAAKDQDERTRERLLARRAPLWVRLKWTARVLGSAWIQDAKFDISASFRTQL